DTATATRCTACLTRRSSGWSCWSAGRARHGRGRTRHAERYTKRPPPSRVGAFSMRRRNRNDGLRVAVLVQVPVLKVLEAPDASLQPALQGLPPQVRDQGCAVPPEVIVLISARSSCSSRRIASVSS